MNLRTVLLTLIAAVALLGAVQSDAPVAEAAYSTPTLPGDLTCDDAVDPVDALQVFRAKADVDDVFLTCGHAANVKCDDEMNEEDAILILKHEAGIIEDLPAGCPAIGVAPDTHILNQGSTTILATWCFDFSEGTGDCGGGTDIHWSIENEVQRYIEPTGGRVAQQFHQDYESFGYMDLYAFPYSTDPIDASNNAETKLPPGEMFGVRTAEGYYAKVKVVSYTGNDINIEYVTYALD